MLTDMAPSATGQFYGSQMGIANISPHIQKTVSITSVIAQKQQNKNDFDL